jgi:hypothetical protein
MTKKILMSKTHQDKTDKIYHNLIKLTSLNKSNTSIMSVKLASINILSFNDKNKIEFIKDFLDNRYIDICFIHKIQKICKFLKIKFIL